MKKKLFATMLTLIMLLGMCTMPFKSRAETEPVENQKQLPTTSNEEDSLLTQEALQEMRSWDDMVEAAQDYVTEEDRYVTYLINHGLKETQKTMYGDDYIKYCISNIELEYVDKERLIKKFQTVLDCYNAFHELKAELCEEYIEGRRNIMNVLVVSKDLEDMVTPVLQLGQQAKVQEGTTYWASAWGFGTGKNGKVTKENPYIPKSLMVDTDRLAYLDENGCITKTVEFHGKAFVAILIYKPHMLHIVSGETDLGWVSPTSLTPVEE